MSLPATLDDAGSDSVRATRWSIVGLLFVAALINYLDRASLSLALPSISAELNLGPAEKGLLLSAFFWPYALMQIPIGLLVDRLSIRWLYALMFAVWSTACGLVGFVHSLGSFIVLRVMLGMGESIYFPGGTKTVSILFKPSQRGLPAGFYDSGSRVGLVLGGLLFPWLITSFGWRTAFMILGFSSLVWLVPWLATVPSCVAPRDAHAAGTGGRRLMPTMNRDLLGLCLGFFCLDYFIYLLLTWLPDYLVTVRHLGIMRAGVYSALPYVIFGLCMVAGGWLGDRLIGRGWHEMRTRKGLVALAFSSGLLLIPAVQAESAEVSIALFMGASLVGLAIGNTTALLQSAAPPDQVGIWTGIENFLGNIAGAVAAWATGVLIKTTGSYLPGFAAASIILALGILPYCLLVGPLRTVRREPAALPDRGRPLEMKLHVLGENLETV